MNIHPGVQAPAMPPVEQRLRARWAELLGIDATDISEQSDFFTLGGNSMLLLGLHIFVTQEFDMDLSIPELVENAIFVRMVELIHCKGRVPA